MKGPKMDLNEIRGLTDDALTERVAGLCGGVWKPCDCGFEGCLKHERWHWPDSTITNGCPDYATDLNAMAEAEKLLCFKNLQWEKEVAYRNYLALLESAIYPRHIVFATAREKAIAFVRAMAPEQEKPT